MALSLRGVYLRALGEAWGAILGWGIVVGVLINSVVVTFPTDPTKRAAFAADIQKVTQNFRFYGDPVALDTFGGYLTWRILGLVPVLLGIWALLAGSRMVRGDEQRGRLDILLSTPTGRGRLLLSRAAAFATAVLSALILAAVFSMAGVAITPFGTDYTPGAVVITMLNIGAVTLLFAALALLLGQVVQTRRMAASITGVLLGAAYFGNNLSDSSDLLKALRVINPLYYYSLSKPLIDSIGPNWAAIIGLLVVAVIFTVAALWVFVRRDIGQPFALFQTTRNTPSATVAVSDEGLAVERANRRDPATVLNKARTLWLRNVFGATLRDLRGTLVFWAFGSAAFTWLIISIAKSSQDAIYRAIADNPLILKIIGGDLRINSAYLSYALFTFLPVIVALYAITLVAGWCGDQEDGRLEILLSAPLTRTRLIVERLEAAGTALAVVLAVVYVTLLVAGAAYDFSFDRGNAAIAVALCWPLAMAVVGGGFLLAAVLRRPNAAVSFVATLTGILFFVELLGRALNLPDWLTNFSPFTQFGQPLLNGLDSWSQAALIVEAAVLVVASVLAFRRRDIVK